MPQRRSAKDQTARIRIERALENLDKAMTNQDAAEANAIVSQVWDQRALTAEVLCNRLATGRSPVPAFEFQLLTGLAGSKARTLLRRIANDKAAPDIVRFGAQRRAGYAERGEAKRRLSFLDSLQAPDETLVLAAFQGSATWPPSGDILGEVVAYLDLLPDERRARIVFEIARGSEGKAQWLLHSVLHMDAPAAQQAALDELTRLRLPGTAAAVRRLSRTTTNEDTRSEAEASLRRLRLQVVGSDSSQDSLPFPPVQRALATQLDGDGGQMVLVFRELSESVYLTAHFFHNDSWGIKDCYGRSWVPADQLEATIASFDESELDLVDVDLEAVRGILQAALDVNAATGHPLPPAFELWEPFIHDSYPPEPDETVESVELDDSPYADRTNLARSAGDLFEHPYFDYWFFDFEDTARAMARVATPGGEQLTASQYSSLIEQLAEPELRRKLRSRLARQAYLFERTEETRERDLALAASASLANDEQSDLGKNAFLHAMVDRSVSRVIYASLYQAFDTDE